MHFTNACRHFIRLCDPFRLKWFLIYFGFFCFNSNVLGATSDAAKPNSSKQMRNTLLFFVLFGPFNSIHPTVPIDSTSFRSRRQCTRVPNTKGLNGVHASECIFHYLWVDPSSLLPRVCSLCVCVCEAQRRGKIVSVYRSQSSSVALSPRAQWRGSFAVENSSN